MPAAREMNGSACSLEMEDESMSDWGSPHSTNMKNEKLASEQLKRDPDEDHGAHFNCTHFGVICFLNFVGTYIENISRILTPKKQLYRQDLAQYQTQNL